MADYISEKVYRQFISSAIALDEGLANSIVCSKKQLSLPGLDLNAFSRHFKLMAKYGWMNVKEMGTEYIYTLSPKGEALLDYYFMSK